MIRVFVGFDDVESAAYHVFEYSIHRRASEPVSITPIMLSQLKGVFNRDRDPLQSNDFSFARWLVPYLCGYEGWALFFDCDMLMLDDIAEIWALRDERYAVQVVKHEHNPKEKIKYLGNIQTKYEKKNWSSVMLMNCGKCKALTPEYVGEASGLDLHQFKWLGDDSLIGELPHRWNFLVGYDAPYKDVSNVHYTTNGPWLQAGRDCDYADEWRNEFHLMSTCDEWTIEEHKKANE